MPNMKLSREYDLPKLCALFDAAAADSSLAGIVVDAMEEMDLLRDEARLDVCLLYARDKGACEGLTLPPILPTDFPPDVFEAWHARVFGEVRILTLPEDNIYVRRLRHSRPAVVRYIKRRTLANVPLTFQRTWRGRKLQVTMSELVPAEPVNQIQMTWQEITGVS